MRFLIMRRDNFKCNACGKSPTNNPGTELHIDHILAWDKGEETIFENLQTLCSVCNIGKSNLDFNV
jgi:5-methylcytosine-specific restriction endonuclease McrA